MLLTDPSAAPLRGSSAFEEFNSGSRPICTFFTMGGCSRGERCHFSHHLTQQAPDGADVSGGFFISGRVANYKATLPSPAPPTAANSMGNGPLAGYGAAASAPAAAAHTSPSQGHGSSSSTPSSTYTAATGCCGPHAGSTVGNALFSTPKPHLSTSTVLSSAVSTAGMTECSVSALAQDSPAADDTSQAPAAVWGGDVRVVALSGAAGAEAEQLGSELQWGSQRSSTYTPRYTLSQTAFLNAEVVRQRTFSSPPPTAGAVVIPNHSSSAPSLVSRGSGAAAFQPVEVSFSPQSSDMGSRGGGSSLQPPAHVQTHVQSQPRHMQSSSSTIRGGVPAPRSVAVAAQRGGAQVRVGGGVPVVVGASARAPPTHCGSVRGNAPRPAATTITAAAAGSAPPPQQYYCFYSNDGKLSPMLPLHSGSSTPSESSGAASHHLQHATPTPANTSNTPMFLHGTPAPPHSQLQRHTQQPAQVQSHVHQAWSPTHYASPREQRAAAAPMAPQVQYIVPGHQVHVTQTQRKPGAFSVPSPAPRTAAELLSSSAAPQRQQQQQQQPRVILPASISAHPQLTALTGSNRGGFMLVSTGGAVLGGVHSPQPQQHMGNVYRVVPAQRQ